MTSGMQDNWVPEAWSKQLTDVLQMMTMQEFQVSITTAPVPALDAAVWWTQPFDIAPDAPLLIGTPKQSWMELGKLSLEAAGIDEIEETSARSTYIEILQQSFSSLARVIALQLGKPVECQTGGERQVQPPGTAFLITLSGSSAKLDAIVFFVPPGLAKVLAPGGNSSHSTDAAAPSQSLMRTEQPPNGGSQKPIDLLLDVEMPVSISFGRAHLPLRDVLKFTAGSVVELNRQPGDPVDVVVNNCVIARGEVVVVDGNYGVRIHEIVSRQQRLAVRNFDRIPATCN